MVSQPGKLTNPFDMAFESDVEANDMFMDLTTLQATLPDPHVPTENTGNLTGSWISQNSSVPYIPSASQGILMKLGSNPDTLQEDGNEVRYLLFIEHDILDTLVD